MIGIGARPLLRFAIDGIQRQRGRSLLTMIGMGIGTASVVAVVSIGLIGRNYVVSLIEGVGSNLVFAHGTGIGPTPTEVFFEDLDLVRKRVRGVSAMAPVLNDMTPVTIKGEGRVISVLGSTSDYAPVRNLKMVQGRFFSDAEDLGYAKVAVISKELWKEYLGGRPLGDDTIRLFDLKFRIIGIYKEGVESAAALEKSEAAGLVAIAGISLLVAGIGIMNIMLVTVSERTRDIGIRLALGAGRRDILLQFLMEASMLSLAGALLGVTIGAGMPLLFSFVYDVPVPVSGVSVGIAFGVSLAVGVFFGLYPARKAADMNIVDSLSYE